MAGGNRNQAEAMGAEMVDVRWCFRRRSPVDPGGFAQNFESRGRDSARRDKNRSYRLMHQHRKQPGAAPGRIRGRIRACREQRKPDLKRFRMTSRAQLPYRDSQLRPPALAPQRVRSQSAPRLRRRGWQQWSPGGLEYHHHRTLSPRSGNFIKNFKNSAFSAGWRKRRSA